VIVIGTGQIGLSGDASDLHQESDRGSGYHDGDITYFPQSQQAYPWLEPETRPQLLFTSFPIPHLLLIPSTQYNLSY
jgi:hypothetical protein